MLVFPEKRELTTLARNFSIFVSIVHGERSQEFFLLQSLKLVLGTVNFGNERAPYTDIEGVHSSVTLFALQLQRKLQSSDLTVFLCLFASRGGLIDHRPLCARLRSCVSFLEWDNRIFFLPSFLARDRQYDNFSRNAVVKKEVTRVTWRDVTVGMVLFKAARAFAYAILILFIFTTRVLLVCCTTSSCN